MSIYRHVSTKRVLCVFFVSAIELARIFLPVSDYIFNIEKSDLQLLPRPLGLGDDSSRRASSMVPFANVAILPHACAIGQAL